MTRFASKRLLLAILLFLFCSLARPQAQTNTTVYIYDELGRLKAVITPSGEAAIYSYDAAGNIVSITRRLAGEVSVIEFTPDGGSIGTSVTIYGTGFSTVPSQNTVQFNGVSAQVTSASATQLLTSVPAGATTGPISITTPTGQATSTSDFNVNLLAPTITGFTPTIGVASNISGTGGTAVTINGTNFETTPSNNQVTFNVTNTQPTTADASTMSATVPHGGTSGRISVSTSNGVAVSANDFFVAPPPFLATDVIFTGRMSIGETRTVTIGTANRIGLLIFDGTIGQNISVNISGVTISNSNVTIFKPNGSVLLTSTGITSTGRFIDTRELTATGTYTILIDPTSTATGNMNITLNGISDVTGTIEVGGPPVTTTTTVAGQNARLTFNALQGQRLALNLTGVTISNSNVSIIGPDGTSIVTATSVTTAGRFIETPTLSFNGVYTILVDPQNAVTGSMTLALNAVPPDQTATITAGGPPVTLTLAAAGQNGRVTFTGTAGQRVSLLLSDVTISSSTVSILKPDGSVLITAANMTTSGWFFDNQTLPVAGTYTVLIDPKIAATGNVTLALYDTSTAFSGTIVIGGPQVTVTIDTPGVNGQLSFTGTAGQIVTLEWWGTMSFNTSPHIVKPDGTELTSNFGFEANGFRLPVTGTYTIPIDPFSSDTGETTFVLYEIPQPVTATIQADGPPVTVTIPTASQMANITFTGTAGQKVSLRIKDINTGPYPFYTWVEVVRPNGAFLADEFAYPEGYFDDGFLDRERLIDTFTLPDTGTYTINVYPELCSGSYTFELFTVPADVTGTITSDGTPVTVTTTVPGQDARLTFSGTAGQRMSLKATEVIHPYSFIDVFSPSGSFVGGFSTETGDISFEDSMVLPTTGTYTIVIDGHFAFAGTTTLSLHAVPAISTVGSLTFNGPPVTFTTTAPGQDIEMTFNGTAGQRMGLKVVGPLSSDIIIFRPSSTQTLVPSKFIRQIGDTTAELFETIVLPTTGTYRVRIDTWFTAGEITATLYEVPPDIDDGVITIGGPPVTVTSTGARQNRTLTFSGTQGQIVHMLINSNTNSWLNHVFVNQPSGANWTRRFADNAAQKFLGGFQLPATGTYTVVTELFGSGDSVTLTLREGTGEITGTIAPDGQPNIVTVPASRQFARYTFNGVAGQRMTLRTNDATFSSGNVNMSGTVIDCCAQSLVSVNVSPERFNVHDLTTTGTQFISVIPRFDFTGSVTLRLLGAPPDITGAITPDGSPVNLTTSPGQNASFTLQGTTGQQLTLRFTNNTIGKINVEMISPTGTSQAFHVNAGSNFDVPTQVLSTPGPYTIRIDPYRGNAGSVTFSVTSP